MELHEDAKKWLETATKNIRFGPDRRAVEAELREHIEDKTADMARIFRIEGEEAEAEALKRMGDPAEIGKRLARLHRPWLGYLWRVSQAALALSLVALLGLNFVLGDDAWLGDDSDAEIWDFDSLPYDAGRMDLYEEIYLPGDDPGQILTLTPAIKQKVAGQNVSLLRGALWEENGNVRVLYLYLRVDSWQFWQLGWLNENWFRITDSRGNAYGLGAEGPKAPGGGLLSDLSLAGKGPFHRGYALKIWGLDPKAEWVRLDYGPGEKLFSLTVEWKEETV